MGTRPVRGRRRLVPLSGIVLLREPARPRPFCVGTDYHHRIFRAGGRLRVLPDAQGPFRVGDVKLSCRSCTVHVGLTSLSQGKAGLGDKQRIFCKFRAKRCKATYFLRDCWRPPLGTVVSGRGGFSRGAPFPRFAILGKKSFLLLAEIWKEKPFSGIHWAAFPTCCGQN